VNAFYIQQFNSLVVPLAFLNAPHYVHGAPKYINYATIALTIAHEALHSLDSSGIKDISDPISNLESNSKSHYTLRSLSFIFQVVTLMLMESYSTGLKGIIEDF
jgi:hypothetical protein